MKPKKEEIIIWAREAGLCDEEGYSYYGNETDAQRFAALAYEAGRNEERESCAQLLDDAGWTYGAALIRGKS